MTSWMHYEVPLSQELTLEATIREVVSHPDKAKVSDLCASLIRQNFYQQQLLNKAVQRISELELVAYLGATASEKELDTFTAIAREICNELGIE